MVHFKYKQVISFEVENKWPVSILNTELEWTGLKSWVHKLPASKLWSTFYYLENNSNHGVRKLWEIISYHSYHYGDSPKL